jgi:hypothetical protein
MSTEPTESEPFNPTRIAITGRVPVVVVVNLETGDVEQVVVEDDSLEWTDPAEGWDVDTTGNPTPDQFARAIAVAADADWPGWEFGW